MSGGRLAVFQLQGFPRVKLQNRDSHQYPLAYLCFAFLFLNFAFITRKPQHTYTTEYYLNSLLYCFK